MNGSAIIPGLQYRDAPAAIEFLCAAFGFERHLIVPGEDGTIMHAQLTIGSGMVMLGSPRPESRGALADAKAAGVYIVDPDPDAVCAQARAAGAEIVREPQDEDYGGRGFQCRDPEGFTWSVGSYDPWATA